MKIVVNKPTFSTHNGAMRLSADLEIDGKNTDLWFQVSGISEKEFINGGIDAFVVASVLPAIIRGHDIEVRGPMSCRLQYNLSNYLIPILCDFLQLPRAVRLHADENTGDIEKASGVASGFSGGIDSFCLYHDHAGEAVPAGYKLSHFLFNNVGSHGQRESDRKIFQNRFNALRGFAEGEGRHFIPVDSNLDEFIGIDFQLTHTVRNAVVALLLQGVFSKFLYASGPVYAETSLKPGKDMAALDPVILPLLGTERLECIASGGQHTRVEKTARMAKVKASEKYLDVCVNPTEEGHLNCSQCWKCLRTLTTLDVQGAIERYGSVFDLDKYRLVKKLYLIETLASASVFSREIRAAIKDSAFAVPKNVRIAALFVPASRAYRISHWLIPKVARRPRFAEIVNRLL